MINLEHTTQGQLHIINPANKQSKTSGPDPTLSGSDAALGFGEVAMFAPRHGRGFRCGILHEWDAPKPGLLKLANSARFRTYAGGRR
jgi:hypothetical protein